MIGQKIDVHRGYCDSALCQLLDKPKRVIHVPTIYPNRLTHVTGIDFEPSWGRRVLYEPAPGIGEQARRGRRSITEPLRCEWELPVHGTCLSLCLLNLFCERLEHAVEVMQPVYIINTRAIGDHDV
jgi:hypothetical protein